MPHLDYLFESAHPGGTYSSIIPSMECKEELLAFCTKIGIPNLIDSDEYHCTLIYSKQSCPDIVNEDFGLPFNALITGYKVLGTDEKVLVLELYCPAATRLHDIFMKKYGATHDYPEYIAHITIASEFEGELPQELPEFEIIFTGFSVEELS